MTNVVVQTRSSLSAGLLGMLLALLAAPPLLAAEQKPLLQEGKQTIYQRVLTRPEATLHARPGDGAGETIPAFSRYYVYASKQQAGSNWLQVGSDINGSTLGWIAETASVPWKHQLVLAFDNPAGRKPVLFFEQRKDLDAIVESDQPAKLVEPIYQTLAQGGSDERIVARESSDYVDINRNFYLLPILDSEEVYSGSGRTVRMMRVASVTKKDQPQPQSVSKPETASLLRGFSAAVVFVIDSTISMGPYIERTKEAVKRIYDRVESAGLSDKIDFGMIAYRADPAYAPGLEYLTRDYVLPGESKDAESFLGKVRGLQPARVSSGDRFDEDSYAGVMQALDKVDWTAYGARYLVLITDAGAIPGKDRHSSTGLDAAQVNSEAAYRGVATYTMHLLTPQGEDNHQQARQQYRELSAHKLTRQPLYFPVNLGDVGTFGQRVDSLADSIVSQVEMASRGKSVAGSALTADPDFGSETATAPRDDAQRLRESVALMGHAMQLAYIGRLSQTEAPSVLKAWVTDVDLENPARTSFDVRVLLTKNQLSDMQMVMIGILDASLSGITKPETFYKSLQSFAAQLGRDPNRIADAQTASIADLGLMDEYLGDLPYKSDLMNLSQDRWQSLSAQDQLEITNRIRRKLSLYEIYNSDTDRWISLAPDTPQGEQVYPVPFDVLP